MRNMVGDGGLRRWPCGTMEAAASNRAIPFRGNGGGGRRRRRATKLFPARCHPVFLRRWGIALNNLSPETPKLHPYGREHGASEINTTCAGACWHGKQSCAKTVCCATRRPSDCCSDCINPIIDLGRLSQPDGHADEAVKLRQAMESWGLFLVTNHGIGDALMDEMMNVSREFFHQPLEEKQKYTNLIDGKHFQLEGYGNDQVISESQILDWLDRLYLKVDPADERNLSVWPKHPESFRDVLDEFIIKCDGVKNSLLPSMAKLLKLDEDYFVRQFSDRPTTIARFNYYPQCPRPDLVYGIKPHSDATILTILMVDNDVGGLQVLKDGVWYDVPTNPHTFLINLGHHMEIMSNGIFKSPVHRVMTNSKKERISVVLFYFLNLEKEIEPALELIDEKHPARYKKVKIMDYFAGLFEHFLQGTRVIDTVKI